MITMIFNLYIILSGIWLTQSATAQHNDADMTMNIAEIIMAVVEYGVNRYGDGCTIGMVVENGFFAGQGCYSL
jgi:hypothetical protein